MKYFKAMAIALPVVLAAGTALANPCGFEEKGRVVVKGYEVGQTAIPADQKPRLEQFAETAKHRDGICIFAQVDATGSKAANEKVARARADAVRSFLISKGVPAEAIHIARQEKAFTLFGLLPENQKNDRRVVVTHD